jgi:hypothetical protein
VIVRKSAAIRVFPGSIVSLEETLLRRLSLTSRRMPPRAASSRPMVGEFSVVVIGFPPRARGVSRGEV